VKLDEEKNKLSSIEERFITSDDSNVQCLVIPTNEELVIAQDTMKLIKNPVK